MIVPGCPFSVGVLVLNNLGTAYSGTEWEVVAHLRGGWAQVRPQCSGSSV